jgi:hypothetical protein
VDGSGGAVENPFQNIDARPGYEGPGRACLKGFRPVHRTPISLSRGIVTVLWKTDDAASELPGLGLAQHCRAGEDGGDALIHG